MEMYPVFLVCVSVVLIIIMSGMSENHSTHKYNNIMNSYYKIELYESIYAQALCVFHNKSSINYDAKQMNNLIAINETSGFVITNGTLNCTLDKVYAYKYRRHHPCNAIIDIHFNNNSLGVFNCFVPYKIISANNLPWLYKINYNGKYKEDIIAERNEHILWNNIGNCNLRFLVHSSIILMSGYSIYLELEHYVTIRDAIHVKLPANTKCAITWDIIKANQTYFKCSKCVCVIDYKTADYYYKYKQKNCIMCNTNINTVEKYINA